MSDQKGDAGVGRLDALLPSRLAVADPGFPDGDEQINNRHFRSRPNFRYYYYSVRRHSFSLLFSFRSANYNHFRYRELRPFIIVLVIIIVNENITGEFHQSKSQKRANQIGR